MHSSVHSRRKFELLIHLGFKLDTSAQEKNLGNNFQGPSEDFWSFHNKDANDVIQQSKTKNSILYI